jgi:hypothetical protein
VNDGTLLFINFAAYSWLLLVPIVAIEARELRTGLPVALGRAVAVSSAANIVSTLAGTVAVLFTGWVLGYLDVIAQPQAGEGDIAALIALVPCFFLSVWVETLVASPLLRLFSREQVRSALFRANQLSYAMLAIVPVVRFAKSAILNGRLIW